VKPASLHGENDKDLQRLMNVALGVEKADLVITNARLLNVYTGELLDDHTVSVKDGWIACVGRDAVHTIGQDTEVIDAAQRTVIPGLIDGHTHLAWIFGLTEFLKFAIPGGTTCFITETLEPYPVAGYDGLVDFLESLNRQPVKIYATAPSMASISGRVRGISPHDLEKLLQRKDILGIGESYWQTVLQEPDQMLPALDSTLRAGKALEGHSAGARGKKLMAYAAVGISSCHEPIQVDEVLELLRLGIYVMVREGSIRRDLETISEIKDADIDLRRLVLATDGVSPHDLIEKGCMEYVVQKAIDYGFDPVSAIQMATLNVAEHFSLDGIVGGIAPGRSADMLIIPDIRTIQAEMVISNGQVVAMEGRCLVEPRQHPYQPENTATIQLPKAFVPSDFTIPAPNDASACRLRVIEMITDLVTGELHTELPVSGGEIEINASDDIIKLAAIDRTHVPGKTSVGLIKGFGLHAGAFASSAAWDTSDIIVVGANEDDMAMAVNRIREMQGGAVVCDEGKVLAELAMPIFGLISDAPINIIIDRLDAIKDAVGRLGCAFPDPLLTLVTLTGAAIPYLRICEEGLVNLKNGVTVGLFVE
jgi:adenine deaminase